MTTLENGLAISLKVNIYVSYDLILLLGIYPREIKTCPQKDMNNNVQSIFIHNNQKLKTTQMFINRKKTHKF